MTVCAGWAIVGDGPYLGPAGGLTRLPWPAANRYDTSPTLRGGLHELAAGGAVRDRNGTARRWVLGWPAITDLDLDTLRVLFYRPGPYRYLDPFEPNRLTANQSMGTDMTRDATGFSARGQGTVASDPSLAYAGLRSLAWSSTTAVAGAGAGVNLAAATGTVGATWTAVRPSVAHTFNIWARSSVSVSLQAAVAWYSATGTLLGTDTGSGATVAGTWTQLVAANKTSPSTAAYAIPIVQTTTSTGTAVTVNVDSAQFEEGTAATAWRLGAGTPLVAVESPLAERMLRAGLREAELTLQELSP